MFKEPVRLQKYIAKSGRGSRREAESWIESGKVYVNGKKAILGMKVVPSQDRVTLKGEVLEEPEMVTVIFHKPRGFLCNNDGRREGGTIFNTFLELSGLKVVAGLEKGASGIIILSNDGDLMQAFSQSYREVERVFKIRVKGEIVQKSMERLTRGVKMDDRIVKLDRLKYLEKTGDQYWYEVMITDHRDRLLEKVFKQINQPIQRIQQVGLADLRDSELKKGKGRVLTKKEMMKLRVTLGVGR